MSFNLFNYLFRKNYCALESLNNFIKHNNLLKVKFCTKIEQKQEETILRALNSADEHYLQSLKITKNRIKNIIERRNQYGNFKTMEDILQIKGIDIKVVNNLYKVISNANDCNKQSSTPENIKIRGQLVTPSLKNSENLSSVVGININPNFISWSKIERNDCHLTEWDMIELSSLANKKCSLIDIYDLVVSVIDKIPMADAYILESAVQSTGQKQLLALMVQQKTMQLTSVLLTLLNARPDDTEYKLKKKVYFLRSKLPARLFRTLIGNEKVSSDETILKILNGENEKYYQPVKVEQHFKSVYTSMPGIEKEILGQALLLTLTFLNICVYKNLESLKVISRQKDN